MDLTSAELEQLIVGMRAEYANGNNVMAYARNVLGKTIGEGGPKSPTCNLSFLRSAGRHIC